MSFTPARSAAAIMARPSSAEKHIGFSTKTCRPARAAASAIGAWLPEVSTMTAFERMAQQVAPVGEDGRDAVAFGAGLGAAGVEVAHRDHLVAVG